MWFVCVLVCVWLVALRLALARVGQSGLVDLLRAGSSPMGVASAGDGDVEMSIATGDKLRTSFRFRYFEVNAEILMANG